MENAITDTKFHVRMVSVCTILAAIDGYLIYGAVVSVQTTGPSMQLLFGFEYIALAVAIVTSFIKYCLNAADTYSGEDTPWEAKKQYFSYLDLLSDFLKLIVYISFFLILMNFYGPLHAHAAHGSTRLRTVHAPANVVISSFPTVFFHLLCVCVLACRTLWPNVALLRARR